MSLMEGPLARELKMLKACGKQKDAADGFWFWFCKVDDTCVLVMRPRDRDPEGAKLKGAVALARSAVKKATQKSPKQFVTGEAYYESSALRFYGNRAFAGFKEDIRDFARDYKLRFLVGAQLYLGARGEVALDSDSDLDYEYEDHYQELDLLAQLSDDPGFDVDAFLSAELGSAQVVSAHARDLLLDPSVELLTPAELQERVTRSTAAARRISEELGAVEASYSSLLLKVSRSGE